MKDVSDQTKIFVSIFEIVNYIKRERPMIRSVFNFSGILFAGIFFSGKLKHH